MTMQQRPEPEVPLEAYLAGEQEINRREGGDGHSIAYLHADAEYRALCDMLQQHRDHEQPKPDWFSVPLGLARRSPWVEYNRDRRDYDKPIDAGTEEFEITLATGGPGIRIVATPGGPGEYPQITDASLEYSHWGVPWTKYHHADISVLCEIANIILDF